MILEGNGIGVYDNDLAKDEGFYTGHMNLQTLPFDPLITGYAFIIWTKVPKWLEELFPGFKAMTQKNFKSFSGIDDMTLNTASYNFSFNNNEYKVNAAIEKGNTAFSLTHQEFSRSPIKNMYQAWVSGISDPRTGIATYPKQFGMEYAAKNHTGELIYIVTRPDANNVDKKNIEFAAYYTNVMPTKIPLSHFNYDQGTHDAPTITQDFVGNMNISPNVDNYAAEILKSTYSMVAEGMFDPKNPYSDSTLADFKLPNSGITGTGTGDLADNA